MTEPWWTPSRHQDRRAGLLARNAVKAALRAHFERMDFVEAEAAALQVSPGNETHLHAFATQAMAPDGTTMPLYLHTSPEFALKKLLAAGERRLFDFARVFRNREGGPRHAAEFVMLEWYRAGEDYTAPMDDCAAILRVAAEAAGSTTLRHGARTADPFAAPERLTVADAFTRHAGIDLPATLTDAGAPLRPALAAAATAAGVRVVDDDGWSDIFSRVMAERIEPAIGNARVAERFELFACGVELANAFGELRDPAEQRRRFEADMADKQRLYGERYPIDEDFLAALPHTPDAAGCALGFDRLVMLLLGVPRISDVQWTPGGANNG